MYYFRWKKEQKEKGKNRKEAQKIAYEKRQQNNMQSEKIMAITDDRFKEVDTTRFVKKKSVKKGASFETGLPPISKDKKLHKKSIISDKSKQKTKKRKI